VIGVGELKGRGWERWSGERVDRLEGIGGGWVEGERGWGGRGRDGRGGGR